MNHTDGKVGMLVLFGRTHGEQTLGVIVKVNPKKFKVKQMEARGSFRNYPVGTVWTVPASLCTSQGEEMPRWVYIDAVAPARPRRRQRSGVDRNKLLSEMEMIENHIKQMSHLE